VNLSAYPTRPSADYPKHHRNKYYVMLCCASRHVLKHLTIPGYGLGPFSVHLCVEKMDFGIQVSVLCSGHLKYVYIHFRKISTLFISSSAHMFIYGALLEVVVALSRRVGGNRIQFPAETMIFPSEVSSIPALGQLLRNLSQVSGRSVKLPTHLQITPMLMHITLPPLLHTS
jgi:hypothetical protein